MPTVCKTCGEHMDGDGYKVVLHCPHADEDQVACAEPDANPIECSTIARTDLPKKPPAERRVNTPAFLKEVPHEHPND